jgi:tRNA(adenine34) deaminase
MKSDEYWMQFAILEAKKALEEDEIPIGAVIVQDDVLIATAYNQTRKNPLAHAEKIAIESLLPTSQKYLQDCVLYCTVEPCVMCTGLIILARVGRLVFGTYDDKAGACGSLYHLLQDARLNHHPKIISGILADECKFLIQSFFQEKRISDKKNFT